MKTMLETLRLELDEALAKREPLRVHVVAAPWRREDDDELLHNVVIEDVGSDYIQIDGRLISRSNIREVQVIG